MKREPEIFSFKLKRVRSSEDESVCSGCVFLVKHDGRHECLAQQVLGDCVPGCTNSIFVREGAKCVR
jgi:hypothetical protein